MESFVVLRRRRLNCKDYIEMANTSMVMPCRDPSANTASPDKWFRMKLQILIFF